MKIMEMNWTGRSGRQADSRVETSNWYFTISLSILSHNPNSICVRHGGQFGHNRRLFQPTHSVGGNLDNSPRRRWTMMFMMMFTMMVLMKQCVDDVTYGPGGRPLPQVPVGLWAVRVRPGALLWHRHSRAGCYSRTVITLQTFSCWTKLWWGQAYIVLPSEPMFVIKWKSNEK